MNIPEGALKADGFDEAVIGIATSAGREDVLAYDWEKCIQILMLDGMAREDAMEYFDFNVVGSYMGDKTPVFIELAEGALDGN